jgi:ABC-type glucose/galactose transport system permease subunit
MYASGRTMSKDIAIFRPSSGLWAISGITRVYFGTSGDKPVTGYDAAAIYRPSSGLWAISGMTRVYFGGSSDQPIPGNYTGFEPTDIAIFNASSGLWAVQGVTRAYFGNSGDIPISGLSINPSSASIN